MTIQGNWDRTTVTRRRLLRWGGIGVGGLVIGSKGLLESTAVAKPFFRDDPFSLGVASGDPLPDGVVLWTRLAPEPLAEDGSGGLPPETYGVRFEVAEDEGFRRIVRRGAREATPELAHSVHVEVDGLAPGREYFYRFKAGPEVSPIGRTKTAPPAAEPLNELRIAVVSCHNYPSGYFTAHGHLAEEDLDLVFYLGDYIYEGEGQGRIGRGHQPAREVSSLEDYRVRYGQYKNDEQLQAAHAAHPFVVVLDDHEVENGWAGEHAQLEPGRDDDPQEFLRRRARAFQAYYEHQPLRSSSIPRGPDMQLYRRLTYGTLVQFDVLDTRQYRSNQVCGDGRSEPNKERPCPESAAAERSILGEEQEAWLFEGLASSTARWNALAQQKIFAQLDRDPGEGQLLSMDSWDGYVASRQRVIAAVEEHSVANPVVLAGDSHQSWAFEVLADFDDPSSDVVATEFAGTSISSGGDGSEQKADTPEILAENPHLKFYNNRRGYMLCSITPERWRTDYRVIQYVSRPGAPISTRATFVVVDGNPGLESE